MYQAYLRRVYRARSTREYNVILSLLSRYLITLVLIQPYNMTFQMHESVPLIRYVKASLIFFFACVSLYSWITCNIPLHLISRPRRIYSKQKTHLPTFVATFVSFLSRVYFLRNSKWNFKSLLFFRFLHASTCHVLLL